MEEACSGLSGTMSRQGLGMGWGLLTCTSSPEPLLGTGPVRGRVEPGKGQDSAGVEKISFPLLHLEYLAEARTNCQEERDWIDHMSVSCDVEAPTGKLRLGGWLSRVS